MKLLPQWNHKSSDFPVQRVSQWNITLSSERLLALKALWISYCHVNQHYSIIFKNPKRKHLSSKCYLKSLWVTSYLSSVDILHYKAQPILCLEWILQRLWKILKYILNPDAPFVSNATQKLFESSASFQLLVFTTLLKSLCTDASSHGLFGQNANYNLVHTTPSRMWLYVVQWYMQSTILTVRNGCRVFFKTLLSVRVWATSSCSKRLKSND